MYLFLDYVNNYLLEIKMGNFILVNLCFLVVVKFVM